MNVILVSNRLARSISLSSRHLILLVTLFSLLVAGSAFLLGTLFAPGNSQSSLRRLLPGTASHQAEIDSLAIKLGELQAKLMRLDGFAKRIGSKTGIEATPFLSDQPVPQGGTAKLGTPLSATTLRSGISTAERQIAAYLDQMMLADAALMLPSLANLPISPPVPTSFVQTSSFGARIDPVDGHQTFHEGIDFRGDIGTPVKAAGSGIVIYAAYHPEYGNMIDLDHGNGLTSRYAHNSKLNVREGDRVNAGQVISLLGNSGRSTGAHLHFEIRYKNVPQNPMRFLTQDIAASKTANALP